MGRILAVDIGNRRTGYAISDPAKIIAMPYRVSENDPVSEIKQIITEQEIDEIILGEPLSLSGQSTDQTRIVYEIKARLEEEINLPIKFIDERFTSRQAKNNMSSIKAKRSIREKSVDAEAAAIILSTYLDRYEANKA